MIRLRRNFVYAGADEDNNENHVIVIYLGHNLDLSRSRDVIGHVTIRLAMGHFLLVVLWTKSLSLTVSKIFRPKHHVLIDTMLNRHCVCAISRDVYPYVKFKYIFQFLTPTLPMKNKGCSLSEPLMVKAKSSENFLSPKICQILTF